MDALRDIDPVETQEWCEALDSVLAFEGAERAQFLLGELADEARRQGAPVPYSANTPYLNTIRPDQEERHPGDRAIEHRIRSLIRWNALATVLRANKESSELGGHIASFQSAATLYDVGFMHFWHGATERHGGDLVYLQGHSSPGFYARAFLEGRLTEEQMLNFRQEVDGKGLSSYPHPWLMPHFWQFPTVSMGLGPLMAIYQARFLKYLHHRGLAETANRKVWAFLGDGETAVVEVFEEPCLVDRHQRTETHRHGRELPEMRHQPGVRVGREALASHLLAEVEHLLLAQPPFQERARVEAGRGMSLEENEVAAVPLGGAVPEMHEADIVERRRRLEARDVPAELAAFLVGAQHGRQRVPADQGADAVLNGAVAALEGDHGVKRLAPLLGLDRVDVARDFHTGISVL